MHAPFWWGLRPAMQAPCSLSFVSSHHPPSHHPPAETNDTTIFNALTLLVVLGTSLITQLAGLSLALGAFLAGLLLAETEYHLQARPKGGAVESACHDATCAWRGHGMAWAWHGMARRGMGVHGHSHPHGMACRFQAMA